MSKFQCLITDVGAVMIARAAESGAKLNLSHMAVGDGDLIPSPAMTALVSERYRAPLNTLKIASDDQRVIIAEMVIQAGVGGFWTRECGLFAEDGTLVAIGNMPPSYKPVAAEGSGRIQTVRMSLIVSATHGISLIIDPSVVMATVQYVNEAVAEVRAIAEDAAALAASRPTFDEIYPIGDVKFFATFLNPNKQWPGTLWYYTGENKSIRIAKEDGSDVMGTGGADTVTLSVGNMPKHNHGVSGQVGEFDHGTKDTSQFDHGTKWASEFDHGTKWTSEGGEHAHQGGMRGPGEKYGETISGTDNDGAHTLNWTSQNGRHSHTVDIGKHNHSIDIGSHGHSVNIGKHSHSIEITSAEVGGGQAFSIVENHIKLMCWYRAA
ncbi:phage tail protein [Serratia surfactantfaciens]|uniref:phage tail protein n=1 Tax=Serratia surfactantfaciens TaxID=2741499 RepID=UPI001B3C631B|nr:phage tail protein [Serratia surfactantfaciens]